MRDPRHGGEPCPRSLSTPSLPSTPLMIDAASMMMICANPPKRIQYQLCAAFDIEKLYISASGSHVIQVASSEDTSPSMTRQSPSPVDR